MFTLFGLLLLMSITAQAQTPPAFSLEIVSGGLEPWGTVQTLRLNPDGTGVLEVLDASQPMAAPETQVYFILSDYARLRLWKTIEAVRFFSLPETFQNPALTGGSYLALTVRSKGRVHTVRAENVEVPALRKLVDTLNALLPKGYAIVYEVPPFP